MRDRRAPPQHDVLLCLTARSLVRNGSRAGRRRCCVRVNIVKDVGPSGTFASGSPCSGGGALHGGRRIYRWQDSHVQKDARRGAYCCVRSISLLAPPPPPPTPGTWTRESPLASRSNTQPASGFPASCWPIPQRSGARATCRFRVRLGCSGCVACRPSAQTGAFGGKRASKRLQLRAQDLSSKRWQAPSAANIGCA